MPNWCRNLIIVVPNNPESMGELYRLFLTWNKAITYPKDGEKESKWIGNLYTEEGISSDDAVENYITRGEIESVELIEPKHKMFAGEKHIRMYCESAWSPAGDDIERGIVRDKYKGLSLYYLAEEPGMEVYINTDESRSLITEKFIIEYCDHKKEDTFYVHEGDKEEDIIDLLAELSGVKIREINDLYDESIRASVIDSFDKKHKSADDSSYLNIYIFEK